MAKWQSGKVAKWQSGKVAKWQSGEGICEKGLGLCGISVCAELAFEVPCAGVVLEGLAEPVE